LALYAALAAMAAFLNPLLAFLKALASDLAFLKLCKWILALALLALNLAKLA